LLPRNVPIWELSVTSSAAKTARHVFLAIYGGRTSREAQQVLAKMKSKYPGAAVKRMQVVFEQIMQ
jgi:hypothetical protein